MPAAVVASASRRCASNAGLPSRSQDAPSDQVMAKTKSGASAPGSDSSASGVGGRAPVCREWQKGRVGSMLGGDQTAQHKGMRRVRDGHAGRYTHLVPWRCSLLPPAERPSAGKGSPPSCVAQSGRSRASACAPATDSPARAPWEMKWLQGFEEVREVARRQKPGTVQGRRIPAPAHSTSALHAGPSYLNSSVSSLECAATGGGSVASQLASMGSLPSAVGSM